MWLFLSAAWVSVVGAMCFVWFYRRLRAAEVVDIRGEVKARVDFETEALKKRLDVVEQRASRLELQANMRKP